MNKNMLGGLSLALVAGGVAAAVIMQSDNSVNARDFGVSQLLRAQDAGDLLPAELLSNLAKSGLSAVPGSSRLMRSDGTRRFFTFQGASPGQPMGLCLVKEDVVPIEGVNRTRTSLGCGTPATIQDDGALAILTDEPNGSWTYSALVRDGFTSAAVGRTTLPVVGNVVVANFPASARGRQTVSLSGSAGAVILAPTIPARGVTVRTKAFSSVWKAPPPLKPISCAWPMNLRSSFARVRARVE